MGLEAVPDDDSVLASVEARYRITENGDGSSVIAFYTSNEFVHPKEIFIGMDTYVRMGRPEFIDVKITPVDEYGKPLHEC